MADPSTLTHALEIRKLVSNFIDERLQAKLEKLKEGDAAKHGQLIESHRLNVWLEDAASRVAQIQLASHTLKPIHPDARGTNLHVSTFVQDVPGLVGTHSLSERDHDVVGNAAALDVFKFLSLECDGRTLLDRVLSNDPELIEALSDENDQARSWVHAFAGIVAAKGAHASHTLAKQLYFPLPEGGYHLLAPLFPTSLVHAVQSSIREDRFGEAAKAAREARREGKPSAIGYREYPHLAIQKFGGTKPQNISQLNSERRGENWLLPSKPPLWRSASIKPPLNVDSIFDGVFGHRRTVRTVVKQLRDFLAGTQHNNRSIRQARVRMVSEVCDEVLQYAATLLELEPGWSTAPECRLHEAEQLWLDPLRGSSDEEFMRRRRRGDWPTEVSKRFGNWLNASIASDEVWPSESEARQWTTDLLAELNMFTEVLEDERT